MPRPVTEDAQVVETWEITTEGTCWVWVYDRREDRYIQQRVGGRGGSKTIHVNRDDRKFNQEQVVDENAHLDIFTNGLLRYVKSNDGTDEHGVSTANHLTEADLIGLLENKDPDQYEPLFRSLDSEVIVRRLYSVAEKHATVQQLEFLRELVDERYRSGGTQRAVREMIESGEKLNGMTLS
jgi:hypothetical protein